MTSRSRPVLKIHVALSNPAIRTASHSNATKRNNSIKRKNNRGKQNAIASKNSRTLIKTSNMVKATSTTLKRTTAPAGTAPAVEEQRAGEAAAAVIMT